VGADRLHNIGHGEDPRPKEDLFAREPLRVAGAIQPLVVLVDDLRHRPREVNALQHVEPCLGMNADHVHLQRAQPAGLAQDLARDDDLPHIVHEPRDPQAGLLLRRQAQFAGDGHSEFGHPPLVSGGVGVAELDRRGEGVHDGVEQALYPGIALRELRLRALAGGDVAHHPAHAGGLSIPEERLGQGAGPDGIPGLSDHAVLKRRRLPAGEGLLEGLEEPREVVRMDEPGERLAHDLVGGVAAERAGHWADVRYSPVCVHGDDDVANVLDQLAVPLRALPQIILGLLAIGDVLQRALHAHDPPRRVPDRLADRADPNAPPGTGDDLELHVVRDALGRAGGEHLPDPGLVLRDVERDALLHRRIGPRGHLVDRGHLIGPQHLVRGEVHVPPPKVGHPPGDGEQPLLLLAGPAG